MEDKNQKIDSLWMQLFDQIESYRNSLAAFDGDMTDGFQNIIEAEREGRIYDISIDTNAFANIEEMKSRFRMKLSSSSSSASTTEGDDETESSDSTLSMTLVNLEDDFLASSLEELSLQPGDEKPLDENTQDNNNNDDDGDHDDVDDPQSQTLRKRTTQNTSKTSSESKETETNESDQTASKPKEVTKVIKPFDSGADILLWFSLVSNLNMKHAQDNFQSSLTKLQKFSQDKNRLISLLNELETLIQA